MAPKPQLQDDPNTFIPPAVRRAAQAADAAFRAQKGEAPPVEPAPPGDASPLEAPPLPSPARESAPPEERPPQEVTQQVTPPAEASTGNEDWERQYKGLIGRYKRQENDIRSMSEQIASMQNLIASMQRPASDTPPELRPQSLLTPEEVSEYGSEFLGVVAKKAKEEFSPEITTLKHKLAQLENHFKTTTEQNTTRARFEMEAAMDRALPQWRDINVMQEFHSWLALPDMYSGAIKHELLRTAYAQNNTPRVLAFFKGFLDQEAAYVPQGGETHQDANLQNGDKVSLESFAAPGRAKTSAAGHAPVEKPIISRAQISAFYADSAAGRWRGRETDKARVEAMIFEAEREGRIR